MAFSKVKHILNLFIAELRSRFGKKPDFAQLTGSVPAFDFPNPSSVPESGFGGAWDSARLESDPAKLLPQMLDQLIVLGQTAEQLRQVLGGNGHQPEKVFELTKQLLQGGDHAP